MSTYHAVRRAQSPTRNSLRSRLVALAVAAAVGVTVLVLTLTAGSSVSHPGSTPSPTVSPRFSLPHIQGLDTPPAVHPSQTATASATREYVRDPGTHALLPITTATASHSVYIRQDHADIPVK